MAAVGSSGALAPETVAAQLLVVLWFASVTTGPWAAAATSGGEETLKFQCFPAPNIICKDFSGNETHFTGSEVGFLKPISCRNVNGYSYKVAVALSLFLGWLGADRFYLGYPALGLLKFCTVGFCGIGSLIDFILISMQRICGFIKIYIQKENFHIPSYCYHFALVYRVDFLKGIISI
ncbi:TM2 domain-containing protein 1 isoform X3 [Tamandua tetradactyla]|uniref:TM2 domain-containing protein 1 isoform X3 n=1 Tax=Tamandua tetradactyla TaxID=48850 RepID=UPI004053C4E5